MIAAVPDKQVTEKPSKSGKTSDSTELEKFLNGRKPSRKIFFMEEDENLPKSTSNQSTLPTASIRIHKNSEYENLNLMDKLNHELERAAKRKAKLTSIIPVCCKCGIAPSDPDYVVSKDLAYCIDCAELLGLEGKD